MSTKQKFSSNKIDFFFFPQTDWISKMHLNIKMLPARINATFSSYCPGFMILIGNLCIQCKLKQSIISTFSSQFSPCTNLPDDIYPTCYTSFKKLDTNYNKKATGTERKSRLPGGYS